MLRSRERTGAPESAPRRGFSWSRALVGVLGAAALVFLLAAPGFLNLFWLRVLTTAFMFAALAEALNLIAGYTGYPAFGNVVFFGLGGYTTAVLMVRVGTPFWVGVVASAAVAGMVALIVGPPLLRLRGHYFAIGTLGLNEATKAIVDNMTEVTGGGQGLSLPIPSGGVLATSILFYYLFFGIMALTLGVTFLWVRSRFGYGSRAIRANEEIAGSLGVHATILKSAAWGISAMLTGLAGGVYAYWIGYIEPPAVFDMGTAVKIFVILLLGGAGTLFGPLLGALFIELVATFTWSRFLDYHTMILGVIIITVAIWLPRGFVAFVRDRVARIRLATGWGRG